MRNEMLQRVKKERNILQTIKWRKSNWIGHICRNCLLNHIIEGKIEERMGMTGRQGRRHKQLLDDLKETRRYWKMKEEVLDCTVWRTHFGRGYGSVVRHSRMNEYTGCNRRNGPDFGRVFLRSYYTDITQNTYIQSSMVTEILAREV